MKDKREKIVMKDKRERKIVMKDKREEDSYEG